MIGKNLYALRDSELFVPGTTREALLNRTGARIENIDMQLMGYLHPLRILKAEYDEPHDEILFKLLLPNGKVALAVSSYVEEPTSPSFLDRIEGTLFSAIPSCFSPTDMKALRSFSIIRGMSEDAIEEMFGYPDSENDWGSSGRQLIYPHRYIYLDRNHKVVDAQYIGGN